MVDQITRKHVRALVDAVRDRPTELPLAEVVDLAGQPVRVAIDCGGRDPIVYVASRRDDRFDGLTPRQQEVAALVAAGHTNGEIADALFISVATVKDHVHAILRRTGLTSRSAVAARWSV